MVHEFEREWRPQWDSLAGTFGMSRNDAVTLASIIEKEARLADERPLISAVYHNRLRRHMPLQADPTVQFALGHHVDRVTFKELDHQVTVQHVSPSRIAAGANRVPGTGESGRRAGARGRPVSLLRRGARWTP